VTDFMDDRPDEEEVEAEAEAESYPEEPVEDVEADEHEDDGISVFAYTRAPVRTAEEQEDFDRDDIKAAVMRLRKEERTPEQPISEWNEDD
jgi:segregation and condensation protein B